MKAGPVSKNIAYGVCSLDPDGWQSLASGRGLPLPLTLCLPWHLLTGEQTSGGSDMLESIWAKYPALSSAGEGRGVGRWPNLRNSSYVS